MKTRVPELDGVRGIAILLVVFFHDFRATFQNGWLGVDIFFVLSGFLITSLLIEEHATTGKVDFKAFYIRRARRLLPAVTALLVVYALFSIGLGWSASNTIKTILAVSLYVANVAWAFHWEIDLAPLGQMWSLSIEEHFYFLWPIAFVMFIRHIASTRKIATLLLIIVCLIAVWRGVLFWQTGDIDRGYYGTDTRADSLLLGCAAAFIAVRARRVSFTLAMLAFVVLCWFIGMNEWLTPFFYFGGFTAMASTVALMMIWISQNKGLPITAPLRLRPLVWIGQISYSLYLWHSLVQAAVEQFGRYWPYKVLSLVASIATASASYYLIERRFLSHPKMDKSAATRSASAKNDSNPLPSGLRTSS